MPLAQQRLGTAALVAVAHSSVISRVGGAMQERGPAHNCWAALTRSRCRCAAVRTETQSAFIYSPSI